MAQNEAREQERIETLDQVLEDYQRLADKKFIEALTSDEERGFELLGAMLDEADAPLYKEVVRQLRAELGVFQ